VKWSGVDGIKVYVIGGSCGMYGGWRYEGGFPVSMSQQEDNLEDLKKDGN
jgi:hypothetical protein